MAGYGLLSRDLISRGVFQALAGDSSDHGDPNAESDLSKPSSFLHNVRANKQRPIYVCQPRMPDMRQDRICPLQSQNLFLTRVSWTMMWMVVNIMFSLWVPLILGAVL